MKWKTIERALTTIASIIAILTFAGQIVNKCSQHTNAIHSSEVETTDLVSEKSGGSDIPASITNEPSKESFTLKWKERKTRVEEAEEKGLFSMLWFLISYFPGLNILFVLVLIGLTLAGHINMRNKGFAEDAESFWFGVLVIFIMCLPYFWIFIFAILK